MNSLREESVTIDGEEVMVRSSSLELRPSGLPAKVYTKNLRIADTEEVLLAAELVVTKKATRDLKVVGLFVTFNGVAYHANERSMSRMATRLVAAKTGEMIKWKSVDGWVSIVKSDLMLILRDAANLTTEIWEMNDDTGS